MSDMVPDSLPQLLAEAIARHTAEDAVAKLVDTKIGEVVKHAVESSLLRWGDVGKQIEKAVSASLMIQGPLDLPSYSTMVLALMRQTLNETLQPILAEKMASSMEDLLQVGAREVKLSTVVDALIKGEEEKNRHGERVTVIVEESVSVSNYWHISLDPSSKTEGYRCSLRLGVSAEGKIYSLHLDQKDVKSTLLLGGMEEYQRIVFAAYATGAKFIVDETDPSTGIGDF